MDLYLHNTYLKLLNKKNNLEDFKNFIDSQTIGFLMGKTFNLSFNPLIILIRKNHFEKFKLLLCKFPIDYFEPNSIDNIFPNSIEQIVNYIYNNLVLNNHIFDKIFRECCFKLENKNPNFLDELINKINLEGFNFYEKFYIKLLNVILYKSENCDIFNKVIYNPYFNLIDILKNNDVLTNVLLIKSSCIFSINYFKSIKNLLKILGISNEDILINWYYTRCFKTFIFKRGSMTISNLVNNLSPLNPNYISKIFINDNEIKISAILVFFNNYNILKEISYGKTIENFDNDLISLITNNQFLKIDCKFKYFCEIYHNLPIKTKDDSLPKYLKNIKKLLGKDIRNFLIDLLNKVNEKDDYYNSILVCL